MNPATRFAQRPPSILSTAVARSETERNAELQWLYREALFPALDRANSWRLLGVATANILPIGIDYCVCRYKLRLSPLSDEAQILLTARDRIREAIEIEPRDRIGCAQTGQTIVERAELAGSDSLLEELYYNRLSVRFARRKYFYG